MKKKVLLLIVVITLFVGCTPEYNLYIDENYIEEELVISGDTNNYASRFNNLSVYENSKEVYYYKSDNEKKTLKYKFKLRDYSESTIAKNCFTAHHLVNENNIYILQTDNGFKCMPFQYNDSINIEYDNLKININVEHYSVIESNADEISGKKYTWYFTKQNYKNKNILIKFKETVKKENKDSEKNFLNIKINSKTLSLILFIVIVAIVIGMVIISMLLIAKKRNKL